MGQDALKSESQQRSSATMHDGLRLVQDQCLLVFSTLAEIRISLWFTVNGVKGDAHKYQV